MIVRDLFDFAVWPLVALAGEIFVSGHPCAQCSDQQLSVRFQ